MDIALVAYEGLNELDVFANLYVLGRVSRVSPDADVRVHLVANKPELRSMHGVSVARQQPLAFATTADAVLTAVATRSKRCKTSRFECDRAVRSARTRAELNSITHDVTLKYESREVCSNAALRYAFVTLTFVFT